VRDYVRVRRAEIDLEAGRRVEAFIAQDHAPGVEAEVDFGEVWVVLNGVRTKCFLFVFWLAHSGKAIHRVYPTQAQEAFLEGHIAAFEAIGGIPSGHIKYDNLKGAVSQVVHGPGPCEGGERAVGAVPLPLRLRRVLLPARHRGRPREGRRGGCGRLVPPQPPHPDARGD
jgi:hypothetical protein